MPSFTVSPTSDCPPPGRAVLDEPEGKTRGMAFEALHREVERIDRPAVHAWPDHAAVEPAMPRCQHQVDDVHVFASAGRPAVWEAVAVEHHQRAGPAGSRRQLFAGLEFEA